ncbi:cytochrome c-type biogenesis protein [Sphingomonas sp. HF-S3]|uniref:Cytochrome c-type biogenesis protein n=1 Tax=Sphingomonas rustica TaxID=3103142 RepID=A0ABV0B5U6_9SPHN
MRRALVLLVALLVAAPALAEGDIPATELSYTQLKNPSQEAQAKALMDTLRCLVCQGQSIADSDAQMAGDMRALVRQRIQAGESPGQVRQWLVERYGDYVTYDPPMSWLTVPLWLTPIALLLIGILIARRSFSRRPGESGQGEDT